MIVVEIHLDLPRGLHPHRVALERISIRARREPPPDGEPGRIRVDDTNQGEPRAMYRPPVSSRAFPHWTHPPETRRRDQGKATIIGRPSR